MTTHSNGDPLARALPPADLVELQRWARSTLAGGADPHALPWAEQQLLRVISELARSRRPPEKVYAAREGNEGRVETPAAEPCGYCGGTNLIRAGACLTCRDCGTSGGCG